MDNFPTAILGGNINHFYMKFIFFSNMSNKLIYSYIL